MVHLDRLSAISFTLPMICTVLSIISLGCFHKYVSGNGRKGEVPSFARSSIRFKKGLEIRTHLITYRSLRVTEAASWCSHFYWPMTGILTRFLILYPGELRQ